MSAMLTTSASLCLPTRVSVRRTRASVAGGALSWELEPLRLACDAVWACESLPGCGGLLSGGGEPRPVCTRRP